MQQNMTLSKTLWTVPGLLAIKYIFILSYKLFGELSEFRFLSSFQIWCSTSSPNFLFFPPLPLLPCLFPFLILSPTSQPSLPTHPTGSLSTYPGSSAGGVPQGWSPLLPAVWCWAGTDEPQPPPRVRSPSSNTAAGCRAKAVALIKHSASMDPLVHSKWEKKTNYRANLQNHSAAPNTHINSCFLPFGSVCESVYLIL